MSVMSPSTHDSPTPVLPDSNRELRTEFEKYRGYLLVLARMHLGHELKGKLDASDIVQQTFLDAHRNTFRGQTEREKLAWLRKILATNLAMAVRGYHLAKRDVRREIEASSARLEAWLAADQPSPSRRMESEERLLELAAALEELPEAQREVVLLKHCHGWRLSRICEHLNKSTSAVAGLLQRGTKQLRQLLKQDE